MKYCVVKNTTFIIDGSENPYEMMIQNAEGSGYTKEQVEIITEEEYQARIAALPKPVPKPTAEEILNAKLIKDNLNIQFQLAQQQKINANLLTQIAKLGGAQ